jgi:hypothetical protein
MYESDMSARMRCSSVWQAKKAFSTAIFGSETTNICAAADLLTQVYFGSQPAVRALVFAGRRFGRRQLRGPEARGRRAPWRTPQPADKAMAERPVSSWDHILYLGGPLDSYIKDGVLGLGQEVKKPASAATLNFLDKDTPILKPDDAKATN